MYGIIYKATNLVNGKIYIGQTTKSLEWRRQRHKTETRDSRFTRALRKYGMEKFNWEVIQVCDSLDELNNTEIDWIAKLAATDRQVGYNTLAGGRNAKLTEEVKQIIREKSRARLAKNPINFTPEIRKKQSDGQRAFYKNNPEARIAIGLRNKERYKNREASIKQAAAWGNHGFFAMKDGTSYGMFFTYKEAARFIKASLAGVRLVLLGHRNNCYGYTFHRI